MRHLPALPATRTRRSGGAAFLAGLLALAVLVPSAYAPARADDDPQAGETATLVLGKNVEVDPPLDVPVRFAPSAASPAVVNAAAFIPAANLAQDAAQEPVFPAPANGYKINYNCTDGTNGSVMLADGKTHTVEGIAVGATCTVTEDTDAAQVPGYTLNDFVWPSRITIAKDRVNAVRVDNEYRTRWGRFEVSKVVTGDQADLAEDKTYTISYTCTHSSGVVTNGTVELKAGETKTVDNVREGDCVITEQDASIDGATLTTSYSVNGAAPVTGQATVVPTHWTLPASKVTVTNDYATPVPTPTPSDEPTPSPSPGTATPSAEPTPSPQTPEASPSSTASGTPKPRPSLARTGAAIALPALLAAATALTGLTLLKTRRRN